MSETVTEAVKDLVQTHHLYQNREVPFKDIFEKCNEGPLTGDESFKKRVRSDLLQIAGLPWRPYLKTDAKPGKAASEAFALRFVVPNVKVYCDRCKGSEAFHPINATEISTLSPDGAGVERIQDWSFGYICQACSKTESAFLVRRSGSFWLGTTAIRLQLTGRAPIEFIEVPKVIPKQESQFFSDALLARNCGQALAGLFMLRTVVEQHALRVIRKDPDAAKLTGGDAVEAYMKTLPDDLKKSSPSMAELYSKLSEAIHAANADRTLFDDSLTNIERHFDGKRYFGIKD